MSDATSPTSHRRTEAAERRKQAMALRIAGASFAQIGERLGVSAQAAHKMIVVSLAEIAKQTAESAEQLRAIELQRLDALQASLWPDAMRGDEQKVDRVLKIMAQRAKLLGLNAPELFAPTDPTGKNEYTGLSDGERITKLAALLDAARARRDGRSDEPRALEPDSPPGAVAAGG